MRARCKISFLLYKRLCVVSGYVSNLYFDVAILPPAKVIFLQVFFSVHRGPCMAKEGACLAQGSSDEGGMRGKGGHAWQRGGVHGKGGHAWREGMHGEGGHA